MRTLVKIAIKILSTISLLGLYSYAYSEPTSVKFINKTNKVLCPLNNGVTVSLQIANLEISGPSGKKWFASYSENGGPAQNMNEGLAIETSQFDFEMSFRNDGRKLKNFTIRIERAWLEDGTELDISDDDRIRNISVYPLTNPNIQAYDTKVKTLSTIDYTAIVGMNSTYQNILPVGASQIGSKTEIIGSYKHINSKIKWHARTGLTKFKSIERTGFGCNSDTIYSNIELKDKFSVDLGTDINACTGKTINLKPSIDLKSTYSYLWSTGERTEQIHITTSGEYSLSVTDTKDNQTITDKIMVTFHDAPDINIADVIIIDKNPITVNIEKENCTYLWSTGAKTGEIQITSSGDYSVMITSEYGCSNSKSFSVKDKSSFFTLTLPNIVNGCGQETVTLSPYMDIDQTYTYLWSTGSTKKEIVINHGGIYALTVTDSRGYSQTAKAQVDYHSKPIVDLGDDFILWDGESKQLDAQNPGSSYKWNTSETSQVITVSSGGNFWVHVIDKFGCNNRDTVLVDYRKGEKFRINLGEDKSICQGDSVLIIPQIIGHPSTPLTYNWLDENHNEAEIYLKKEGDYTLEITDHSGNIERGRIHITIRPTPLVNLGDDVIDYPNLQLSLDTKIDKATYNWSTGEITKSIIIEKTGTYWVEVINKYLCSARDEIYVKFLNDYPFVGLPKAFSPNGDSHNDFLYVRGVDVDKIELMIYNRTGKKVFETSDLNQGWDGKYNGKRQKMDSYYYNLNITYTNGVIKTKTGKITLLR